MQIIFILHIAVYKIVEVPSGAAESTEQLGTKFKFWYSNVEFGLTLFKEGRPGTGENWAEKIACELAGLLGLPHAKYEFAQYQDKEGVISPTITNNRLRLVHGNELLATFATGYGMNPLKQYARKEHTIRRVLSYFRASSEVLGAPIEFIQTERISTALDVFIGYLMFDTWIANQDRHDQNWGILRTSEGNTFLAPTFDHGSSMGRNERDERKVIMLNTKDMGQHISRYVAAARSALFPHTAADQSAKALFTLDAFVQAAHHSIKSAQEWRERLASIEERAVVEIINQVPDYLMSETSRRFTEELLKLNRKRILSSEL